MIRITPAGRFLKKAPQKFLCVKNRDTKKNQIRIVIKNTLSFLGDLMDFLQKVPQYQEILKKLLFRFARQKGNYLFYTLNFPTISSSFFARSVRVSALELTSELLELKSLATWLTSEISLVISFITMEP